MVSLVGNVSPGEIRTDPFPHINKIETLAPKLYSQLAATYPDMTKICRKEVWALNNSGQAWPALPALKNKALAPVWEKFIKYHYSQAFYLDVVRLLGDHMRQIHPGIEEKLGKPLESMTVAPRLEPGDADVLVECQFCINTPIREYSRVRGVHVDNPNKLFNALLYMRLDEDDIEGGDMDLCRFKDKPRFQQVSVPDDAVDVVDHVLYRANTMILLINSPFALHGVTPRPPNPYYRRYFNFLAEFREPIFDLAPYQDKTEPWALLMR